ncbi:MAG: hypothetical protein WA137_11290 [Methanothrix sp.]
MGIRSRVSGSCEGIRFSRHLTEGSLIIRGQIRFASVKDLKPKVLAFIEYFNQTMAKPFKWTYQGKALTA